MSEGNKVTLLGHFKELRQRLVKVLIAVGVTTLASLFFAQYIFQFLLAPVPGLELQFIEPTGFIGTYMKVCLYCGIILAAPYLLYQIVMFVKPALNRNEKGYLFILLPAVLVLFLGGAAFSYYVLLPPALYFLGEGFLNITGVVDIHADWTVNRYVSVVTKLIFWMGLVFEIPLVMYFLTKIGIVNAQMLAKYRKFAVIGAFLLAAIITPTMDPVNQLLVACPIIILYEAGIWLSKLAGRGKKREALSEV